MTTVLYTREHTMYSLSGILCAIEDTRQVCVLIVEFEY